MNVAYHKLAVQHSIADARVGSESRDLILHATNLQTTNSSIMAARLARFVPRIIASSNSHKSSLLSQRFFDIFYQPNAGLRRHTAIPPVTSQDYDRWRKFDRPVKKEEIQETTEDHTEISNEIFASINDQIKNKTHGRLFAVVHITGKQFKVTAEDIIIIQGLFPAKDGDQLRLEKVLMVGCRDFSLIGRPLLNKDLMRIEACVIEKTYSHIKTWFHMIKRKRHMRMRFQRIPFTVLRINSIEFNGLVNEHKDIEGLEDRLL